MSAPKRGCGTQHFLSTKSSGTLVQDLPDGFEVYETVNGQVYQRRQQSKLIRDDERQCVVQRLAKPRPGHRYKVEVQGKALTLHESVREIRGDLNWLSRFSFSRSPQDLEKINEALVSFRSTWVECVDAACRPRWHGGLRHGVRTPPPAPKRW